MVPHEQHLEKALEILKRVPLIDGHNDFPYIIRSFYDNKLDARFDPENDLIGHVDFKRMLNGRGGGIFWSVYVDCPPGENDFSDEAHFVTLRDALQQIDTVHRLVERWSDKLVLVERASDIMKIFKAGKIASMIGVEGLHQICNSSSVLRMYHKLGARYVTLAHQENNLYADSATSKAPFHNGLSALGKDMIKEMNRIGMIIDLSHVSEAVMLDALEISVAPVAFTHSSAFGVYGHPRNVSDKCLEKLKANNGVIMISLIPYFTHEDKFSATTEHVVDHIVYVAEKIGYNHIGLGSDFDGMDLTVNGLEDIEKWPNLVTAMIGLNIAESDIEKVLGLNIIRVLEDVEKVSDGAKNLPAMEDNVGKLWDEKRRAEERAKHPTAQHDHR